ncbi:aspartate-semialdehyde dehydrogenase [Fangia hongkongensis]|uniref:aspartate-semialdehyde dehydrogenase n=1 Tax=Fangia hongkongensis TaxID=270495 RepID=UPI00035E6A7C|nr:aspartate-semialdehyde dehydrogenase [Fangia hongkongensis]MBK2125524.1 aspartate-semialdehyde dehydrogenase [Fangia hongkongensis]
MKKVGFVGWRGMVGSVLMERMKENDDFDAIEAVFFSTSQAGLQAPNYAIHAMDTLQDAYDINRLSQMDIIISTQGSEYTQRVLPELERVNFTGYWIDAASHLRMKENALIVLDPINREHIDQAIQEGVKYFVGGNCTVSLLMLALDGLLSAKVIDWISTMSYQAVSGAGAKAMSELLAQSEFMYSKSTDKSDMLSVEKEMRASTHLDTFPQSSLPAALAYNVLPWIDAKLDNGQSKEEWKAQAELNKVLNLDGGGTIAVDGICVRVPALRAHSQALTIQLNEDIPLSEVENLIKTANPWVQYIENDPEATWHNLTPQSVSGSLNIAVGRLKRSNTSNRHIQLFTVGDQLLWGAAEPLRRMLNILVG